MPPKSESAARESILRCRIGSLRSNVLGKQLFSVPERDANAESEEGEVQAD